MARLKGIQLKKEFGQHFLRDERVVQHMIEAVNLSSTSSVFEIGCGDGFLTARILREPIERLWVFEIDKEWADHVRTQLPDKRLTIYHENFLDIDFGRFEPDKPWTILANLPYVITFPILHRLQEHRYLLAEGVVMVQEEVAQKIVKKSGRGYGFISLFFQWFFEWRLLDKIPPSAFVPPPKVFSRLLYLKPKKDVPKIPDEAGFWDFVKVCFKQPRRTLLNNLRQSHYPIDRLDAPTLALRAQQLSIDDFLKIWDALRH